MTEIDEVYIVEISADHDFNTPVARRVFRNRGAAQRWADQKLEELLARDREDDPTFDAYSYSVSVIPMTLY